MSRIMHNELFRADALNATHNDACASPGTSDERGRWRNPRESSLRFLFFFCSFFRFNSFLPSELYYHGLEHVRGVQVLFSLVKGKTFPRRKFRREKFKDYESFDIRILAVGILELLEIDLRYFQLAK